MTPEDASSLITNAIRSLAEARILPPQLLETTLRPDQTFEELGIDSLGRASLFTEIETLFGKSIPMEGFQETDSLGTVVAQLLLVDVQDQTGINDSTTSERNESAVL